jgi:hypothetical protein
MKDTGQHIEALKNAIKVIEETDLIGTQFLQSRKDLQDVIDLLEKHKPYTVHFSSLHVSILIKIFNEVVKTGRHEFKKKDIPNLTHTEYGNFFTLQRFGLLYFPTDGEGKRIKGGSWGMDRKRVYDFLNGDFKISKYYVRDILIKKNFSSEEKITVRQVKNSENAFKENVPDFVNYVENE